MSVYARFVFWLRLLASSPATRVAWFCLCALWITWPFFDTATRLNEFRDAQVLFGYEDAAARSVTKFGEWPLWDPYYCGGLYGLGTPQARFAAPPFLLSVALGALRAQPLIAFLLTCLGMEGMFRFARRRTGSALGPALMAPLFAANGFFTFSYFSGWLNFYGFQLLPWVLFGVDGVLRRERWGALTLAAAMAFIVGFGGTYAGPMAVVLAAVHVLRAFSESGRLRQNAVPALGALALAGYLALLFSAFRLWPVLESLIAAPRIMAGAPEQPLPGFPERLFQLAAPRGGNYTGTGQMFVGLGFLPLLALGVLRKRSLRALVVMLLWLWIATGYAYRPWTPFAWLRELPVLSALRYPQRFVFLAVLAGCEIIGFGIDDLVIGLRRRAAPCAVLLALALLCVGWTLRAQTQNNAIAARGMWQGPAPLELDQPFKQARGNRWLAAHYAPLNRGSIACWEAYPVPMSPLLRSDLAQEEYLTDPNAGSVQRKHWSPNRIELQVSLTRSARLHVNQNYHPGWRSNVGRVVSDQDLLAVDLPPGQHLLVLRFLPRSALFGGLVSVLGLGALIALALGRRRAGLTFMLGAPLLAGASFLLWDESLPVPAPLRNADGSPVVVTQPVPGARALHAEFALPVTLEGAELPALPDRAGASHFALYFRVQGDVPRTVGVRVELESSLGRTQRIDRDVVGASVYLENAPRGVLLRDAFALGLGTRPGERWKLFVSLWHAAGDHSRVQVRSAPPGARQGERVFVAEF